MDFESLPTLDLTEPQRRLDEVVRTFERQIGQGGAENKRLSRLHRMLPYALGAALKNGQQSWQAIRELCNDKQPIELSVAVPPLVRNLAELLYWTVFLLDAPKEQGETMERVIWAKMHLSNQSLRKHYAKEKEWQLHVDLLDQQRDWWERNCSITPEEKMRGAEDRKVLAHSRHWAS